jgi:hypothetical protein
MSKAPGERPPEPQKKAVAPAKQPGPPPPKQLTTTQKDLLGSGFADSGAARRRDAMIGGLPGRITHDELPAAAASVASAAELTTRDVWKAIVAPVQSVHGQRSGATYARVLAQFNVGTNPRYEPDGPEKNRGHIFIWDVTRAMGCEIPHFVGAKELSLSQTCDWLRHEGPMRGWRKVSDNDVFGAAQAGYPLIAVPREIRLRQLAFIAPQAPNGGRPLCTGAGLKRGADLPLLEVLGVRVVDYFGHE